MRSTLLCLSAALIAGPATAQKLGARTASPAQVLAQMEGGSLDDELARQIAAASAHPLGTAENPVRVGGPEGERSYLARLRCSNGRTPLIGARSAAGTGAFGSIVASYSLDCGAAAPGRRQVIMDMYHAEHDERSAPAGFTLAGR